MTDILRAIDALIDGQLRDGETVGHSWFPKCPHAWCDADWHGLAVTQRMVDMRRYLGVVDTDYKHSEDLSPVVCPGSGVPWVPRPPGTNSPGTAVMPVQITHGEWRFEGDRVAGTVTVTFPNGVTAVFPAIGTIRVSL